MEKKIEDQTIELCDSIFKYINSRLKKDIIVTPSINELCVMADNLKNKIKLTDK